jgi:hypothetical protein
MLYLSAADYGQNSDYIPLLDHVILGLLLFVDNYQRDHFRHYPDGAKCFAYSSSGFNLDFGLTAHHISQCSAWTNNGRHSGYRHFQTKSFDRVGFWQSIHCPAALFVVHIQQDVNILKFRNLAFCGTAVGCVLVEACGR